MTREELKSLRFVREIIERIEDRICQLDGQEPRRERTALQKELADLKKVALVTETKITKFLASVADPEIQLLIMWRFCDLYDWYTIASKWEECTGKSVDRSTLQKKVDSYLKTAL